MRTTTYAVGLALTAGLFLSASGTAARAQQVFASQQGSIRGTLCLDAEGERIAQGTRIIGYPCSGKPNQQFTYMNDGTLRLGGLCVDASGGLGRNGDQIILWRCRRGAANQRWRADNGRFVGINNKCIDLSGNSPVTFGNQPAILFTCRGTPNQLWYVWAGYGSSRPGTVPPPPPPIAPPPLPPAPPPLPPLPPPDPCKLYNCGPFPDPRPDLNYRRY